MSIEAIGSLQKAAGLETGVAGGSLGKEQFLELLVTQLQNQDPLDPTDPQAMVSQLAQFSSLEQMQNLNTQMESSRRDNAWIQSMGLAGKKVSITTKDGTAMEGTVDRIAWQNGALSMSVDGQELSMDTIAAIAAVAEEE